MPPENKFVQLLTQTYSSNIYPMINNINNPRQRKAILVLSHKHELERLEYQDGGADVLLNKELYPLVLTEHENSSFIETLENHGLDLTSGNLLLQSPYDFNQYEISTKAPSTFALAKYSHFIVLCRYLGASKVNIKTIDIKTAEKKSFWNGSFKKFWGLVGSGSINGESSFANNFRNNMEITTELSGGKPNIQEAEEYLKKNKLLGDQNLQTLIGLRRDLPNPNHIKTYKVKLNLSQESEQTFKVVTKLNVPGYVDLQNQIDQVKKTSYQFTLEIEVDFVPQSQ